MKPKLVTLLFSLIFPYSLLYSQTDTSQVSNNHSKINLSGFIDIFYVYDFNQPQNDFRQSFFFNHNRHNEFNLNLGLVKLGLEQSKYRFNFAFHTGTYANDNYAAEPGFLKNIFEANIGISLNENNSLWLDAGILPSHIGFESAISMNNLTLTRSILAENSPYFLAGVKLTYHFEDKWELGGLIINGWQRIQKAPKNSLPSIGMQVKYSPSEKITLNYSNFIGTDDPDSTRRLRYFNNCYGQFEISSKWQLIIGFDIGLQQKSKNSDGYNLWLSPVMIGQYSFSKKIKSALRIEYYQDDKGVITIEDFKTMGVSLNLDYVLQKDILCRIEARELYSQNKIFRVQNSSLNNDFFIAVSTAMKF